MQLTIMFNIENHVKIKVSLVYKYFRKIWVHQHMHNWFVTKLVKYENSKKLIIQSLRELNFKMKAHFS
jgi:hypothetical protein